MTKGRIGVNTKGLVVFLYYSATYIAFEPVQSIPFHVAGTLYAAVFYNVFDGLLEIPVASQLVIVYAGEICIGFWNDFPEIC